jgi:hypothetical protein
MENAGLHLEGKHALLFRYVQIIERIEVEAPAVHRTDGAAEVVAENELSARVIADARNHERYVVSARLTEEDVADRVGPLRIVGERYAQ